MASAVDETLFGDAVLADAQDRGRWPDRFQRGEQIQPFGADILELEADDIDGGGKRAQRRRVGIVADRDRMRDLRRRAVLLSGQDVTTVAQTGCGHGRHATQLAAADETDGGVGRQRKRGQWRPGGLCRREPGCAIERRTRVSGGFAATEPV